MLTRETFEKASKMALEYFEKANIKVTEEEKNKIEVADFGLSDLWNTGLEILTYVNTDRVCAKELVLFPFQTCPEHRHPVIGALFSQMNASCEYQKLNKGDKI